MKSRRRIAFPKGRRQFGLQHGRSNQETATGGIGLLVSLRGSNPEPSMSLAVPEIHRLRGVLLKSLGSPSEEVERALRTALEIAEEQGAFLLKLRAAASLARLWRDHRKVQQARELLAPIYGWWFETRDLKEAKALLEELAS